MFRFIMLTHVLIFSASSAQAAPSDEESLASAARLIFKVHCVECHHAGDAYFDAKNVASMRNSENPMVVPGKPDESEVLKQILTGAMPMSESELSQEEIQTLRQWVEAGAKDFPIEPRLSIKVRSVYAAGLGYLRSVDRESRRHIRFFTLHNLHNRPSVDLEDLRYYRAALAKTLNSMTWERNITVPRVVPVEGTKEQVLYAIDLRDFGWDRERHAPWQAIQRAYPYGISYEFSITHADSHEYAQALQESTATEIPVLRADWFITRATRPPLYHEILEIPTNAKELEEKLGVNIAEDFLEPHPNRIARGGFPKSGVSKQNRMVQRSDCTTGFYWKSYDFKPETGRSKLTRFPLGPANLFPEGQHPYERFAFVHDGGEIIFSLPNGLQGYMLTDGEDNRIDTGPISVVFDTDWTNGTPEIVNGLSCMACHQHGMINFTDRVRDANATFGAVEKHVERLYPEAQVMNDLLARDADMFMRSLRRCIGEYVPEGVSLVDFPEPVSVVAKWHRKEYLEREDVLAELDLTDDEAFRAIGLAKLKLLGLEGLLKDDGVVGRDEWEAFDTKFGPSLMQQTANELQCTPLLPL